MLDTSMHSQGLLKKQKDNFENPRNYVTNNILMNIIMNNTTVKANLMGMLLNTSVSTVEWIVTAIYVEQYWQQTRTGKEMRRIKRALTEDFPWHNHNASLQQVCAFLTRDKIIHTDTIHNLKLKH